MQLDLSACISWAEQNLMDFNASKTEFIAIGEPSEKFLKFGGMSLSPSNLVKDLGVMVSDNLKWEKHISKRISICYSLLSRLRRILPPNLPFSTKLTMYKAYILPSLLYASEVWHPTSGDLRKLELVQKRCCKRICNGNDYKHRLVKCSLRPISCVLQYKDFHAQSGSVGVIRFCSQRHILPRVEKSLPQKFSLTNICCKKII